MQPRYGSEPKPNMSICPKCHSIKEPYQSTCSKCLTRACPNGHRMNETARICPLCGWEDRLWKPPRPRSTARAGTGRGQFDDDPAEYYRCPQCKQKFVLDRKPIDPNSIKCHNPHCGAIFEGKPNRISREDFSTRATRVESVPTPQVDPEFPPQPVKGKASKSSATVKSVPNTLYRPTVGVETSKHLEHFRKPMKSSGFEIPSFKKFLPALYGLGALVVCAGIGFGIWALISSGIFSGNSTPVAKAPETLSVDSVQLASVSDFGARVKWHTEKPSTSQVEYGTTAALGEFTAVDTQLVTDHSVDLKNLKAETPYFYRVKSTAGKAASDPVAVAQFKTAAPPDNAPPVITNIKITNISDIDAVISWKTNEKSTGAVRFGASTSYGQNIDAGKDLTLEHSVKIKELSPSTSYHFIVSSVDASKNAADSADTTFLTLEPVKSGYDVGNRAPDFTLQTVGGKSVTLSALRGQPVILNFWRIACPACLYELPFIEEVYKGLNSSQQAGKPQMYTINLMDYEEHVNNLLNENHYTFPILMDFKGEAMSAYGLRSIPMTFCIDANGIIRRVQTGRFDNADELKEILNSL